MNNMELARFNMVEQQIRPWDVLDADVLELITKIKREQFVPVDKQALAFMDVEIPLGYNVKDVVAQSGSARAAGAEAQTE